MVHPSKRPEDSSGPGVGVSWAAFEIVVRQHYGRLCACAYRYVRSRAAAEDVVHDVLLRTWMLRGRLAGVDLLSYLLQSVRNGAISALRKRRAEGARDQHLSWEAPARTATSSDVVERAELAEAVTAAIDELPDRCRLIFLLHRDADLSYREIAARLDLSVKTVETQMGRALKALRKRLAAMSSAAAGRRPGLETSTGEPSPRVDVR
jgi:RNA polymerase sigma-70 factor, ECF subfamily